MARLRVGDEVRSIRITHDWARMDEYSRTLAIDWFTVTGQPPEAVVPSHGKHYRGIMFRLKFKIPMFVERWR